MARHRRQERRNGARRRRLAGYPLILSLLAAALTFLGAGEPFETSVGLRFLYLLRGPEAPPPNALIIAVDDPTVTFLNAKASAIFRADPDGPPTPEEIRDSDFGREMPRLANCMPPRDIDALSRSRNKLDIPRTLHACLLPILRDRAPTVIFLDILFEERSEFALSDRMLADELRATPNSIILQETKLNPDLRIVIRRFPTAIIRRTVGQYRMVAFEIDNLAGSTRYIERFAYPDVRSAPNVALDIHLGRPLDRPPPEADGPEFSEFWLYGPPGALPIVTMREVFTQEAEVLPDDLSDIAVFVGAWDEVIKNVDDSFTTPLSDDEVGDHSGVELAATAFLNKLSGKALLRPSFATRGATVGILAFILLGLGRLLTGYRGVLAIAVATAVWPVIAVYAFSGYQLWLPFAVPIFILAPLAAILSVGANYARVRDVVERLAPLPIARLLIAQRDRGPMKSREEVATVVFADLTGSTSIAENISVHDFKDLMNSFFEMAANAIENEGGMIDKFMGDGFMALFTESFTGPDHADRGVAAAKKLARDMRVFNLGRGGSDTPLLTMRIGLNTGLISLSEVGARNRANPTAVGDVVNVASRLEHMGRDLFAGEREVILISGATYHYLKRPPEKLVDCGEKNIRGRKTPVKVIRLTIE